jgi:hypothetical protein
MLNAVENKRQVALTQLVDPKFDLSLARDVQKYINSCRCSVSRRVGPSAAALYGCDYFAR